MKLPSGPRVGEAATGTAWRSPGEIVEIDSSVVGLKIGPAAGQTIDHARIHLIPRREGDVANARVVYALSY